MSAKRRALKRAASRGLTLVEMIIVITLIGALMAIIGFAVFRQSESAKIKAAKVACTQFRNSAKLYREDHPDACPSPQTLKDEKQIDTTTSINDPWGKPFAIACPEGGEIVVTSSGPDGKPGSEDDIRMPEAEKK